MTKKIILIFMGILLPILSISAQIIRIENAKYFDSNRQLYNGIYTEYYENGNKKMEMNLKEGEKDSTTILYNENGAISEVLSFKKGLMHGRWEKYNSNGVKISEAFYYEDKKDSTWRIWNEQGQIIYEMHYKHGEKCGTWINYSQTGEIVSKRDYEPCP